MSKGEPTYMKDVTEIRELIETVQPGLIAVLLRLDGSQRSAGLSAMSAITQGCDKLMLALAGKYESPKRKPRGGSGD